MKSPPLGLLGKRQIFTYRFQRNTGFEIPFSSFASKRLPGSGHNFVFPQKPVPYQP